MDNIVISTEAPQATLSLTAELIRSLQHYKIDDKLPVDISKKTVDEIMVFLSKIGKS